MLERKVWSLPPKRPIKAIENAWIPLKDGTRLAVRLWLPEDAERAPVPAVLEYLPYRKRDGTRSWDQSWAEASETTRISPGVITFLSLVRMYGRRYFAEIVAQLEKLGCR